MNAVICLIIFIGMVITLGVLGLYGHGGSYRDPRNLWVAIPLLLLVSFSSYKDKKELIKRCVLALPFTLLAVILFNVIGLEIYACLIFGVILFVDLIAETKNWKRHYVIVSVLAGILMILAVVFKVLMPSYWNIYIVMGFAFAVLIFHRSYMSRLSNSQIDPKILPIAVKSVKFASLCFAAGALLIISHILCRRYQINFLISYTIAILIALGLWGFSRFFNIKDPACSDIPERRAKKLKQMINDGKTKTKLQCEFCSREILESETPWVIKDHVVCKQCYDQIMEKN